MPSLDMGRTRAFRQPWLALALGVVLWCLAAWWPAAAQEAQIPELRERVTDTTGTLDASTVQQLTQTLVDLEQRKGAQIAVLMVPTTDGEAIEGYASRAFEQWKLGRSGVDDGILFVIAKDDRRLRIEVGYGLEGAVTDLQAGRIIREQVAPRFQQGDFAGGVAAGVQSLVKLVEGEELPAPSPVAKSDGFKPTGAMLEWLWPLAFILLVLPPLLAAGGAGLALFVFTGSPVVAAIGAMVAFLISLAGRSAGSGPSRASRHGGSYRSSSRSGWGSGGGGFRGGGGGFGGGGGRSGGGGASGGW